MMRALWLLAMIPLLAAAAPPPCGMSLGFNQPDAGGSIQRPVWESKEREALLFADGLHVNTDGTKRSYSVDDFFGTKQALNTICNAMAGYCTDLRTNGKSDPKKLAARAALLAQARDEGWPKAQLVETRLSSAVIVMPGGKPCPEQDGFLVSATALTNPAVSDTCDLGRYLDALAVAAIVIPSGGAFAAHGARVGDLAVVLPVSGGAPVYAVVGDTGPSDELGEGTVRLAQILLNKPAPPANYDEIRGRGLYKGKGWEMPLSAVLVFPGSRDAKNPYLTEARIEAAGAALLTGWGGADRLRSCAADHAR
jgi:hypothetical protein